MKPNTIGDSRRAACSGERGSNHAAQRCVDCGHKPHEDEDYCQEMIWQGDYEMVGVCGCGWEEESTGDEPATLCELGRRLRASLALLTAGLDAPRRGFGGMSARGLMGGTP